MSPVISLSLFAVTSISYVPVSVISFENSAVKPLSLLNSFPSFLITTSIFVALFGIGTATVIVPNNSPVAAVLSAVILIFTEPIAFGSTTLNVAFATADSSLSFVAFTQRLSAPTAAAVYSLPGVQVFPSSVE